MLRLDYFLKIGFVAKGDTIDQSPLRRYAAVSSTDTNVTMKDGAGDWNESDSNDHKRFITSFAWRTNDGTPPRGIKSGKTRIIVRTNDGDIHYGRALDFDWRISESKYSIVKWVPSIDALIKMQAEHDERLGTCIAAKLKAHAVRVRPHSPAKLQRREVTKFISESKFTCAEDLAKGLQDAGLLPKLGG